jgi:hypothetical protein
VRYDRWEEEGTVVTSRGIGSVLLPWVVRVLLAVAALIAPIITFRAFTESDTPDPVHEQRLREAHDAARQQPVRSRTTTEPNASTRP